MNPIDDFPQEFDVAPSRVRRWWPAVVAAALLAGVVAIGVAASSGTNSPGTTSTIASGPTTTTPTLKRTLKAGMHGPDVRRLQQRLKDLSFDPNLIDGDFGYNTTQSVWAFETLVLKTPRTKATGAISPEAWQLMQQDNLIVPRRAQAPTETHVEIYLPEQVMVVFKKGKPILVTHISTGTGEDWCEEVTIDPGEQGNPGTEPLKKGVCGKAVTPGGLYYFYNRKTGTRQSKLGTMWNPVYFNGGIAVHGAAQVPNTPASHGCVRIPMHISEYFQTLVAYGDRVYVFDGVKEPEEYGAPIPPADKPDPNYTTTTSSTSTTSTVVVTTTTAKQKTTTTLPAPVPTATTSTVSPASSLP
ncbi:MAG: L,D-transpeptidase family protein [Actinomycetes bacterium]